MKLKLFWNIQIDSTNIKSFKCAINNIFYTTQKKKSIGLILGEEVLSNPFIRIIFDLPTSKKKQRRLIKQNIFQTKY